MAYNVVHVRDFDGQSGSPTIRLPRPTDMLPYEGINRAITIEHLAEFSNAVNIKYWDDTDAFRLRQGESIRWRFLREKGGFGRIVAEAVPPRHLYHADSDGTTLGSANVWRITDWETDYSLSLIRFPSISGVSRVDTDAYSVGTVTTTGTYARPEWGALSYRYNLLGMWTVLRDGWMAVDIAFNIELDASTSGSLGSDQYLELWQLREDDPSPVRVFSLPGRDASCWEPGAVLCFPAQLCQGGDGILLWLCDRNSARVQLLSAFYAGPLAQRCNGYRNHQGAGRNAGYRTVD